MHEMLGNQYFMARNYPKAAVNLHLALEKSPGNKKIRRKLIVCYTQTGEIDRAFTMFLSLVKEDIDFIMNADPVLDDCPCPEIIYDLSKGIEPAPDSRDHLVSMGIIWLFCDINRSLEYFGKALKADPDNPDLKSVIVLLENRLNPITNHNQSLHKEVL